jgi:hypothetical protein
MSDTTQCVVDEEHLKLLRYGYFLSGAWNVFWAFFPLIYVAMGFFFMTTMPRGAAGEPDPRTIGMMFAIIGACVSLIMVVLSVLKFLTARALGRRTSRTLCYITAAICCFAIPYGTALGVCTFLVLSRPSVAELFERR